MLCFEELVELARKCYAQARATLNPEARRTLERMGDDYLQKAEKLGESVRAVFPDGKNNRRSEFDS
jgi:hypothetical protein